MAEQFPLKFESHNRTRTETVNIKTFSLLSDSIHSSSCIRRIEGKRETWRISTPEDTFYIKIFFNNGFSSILLPVLGLSKLQKEIWAFRALKTKGILIPELVAQGYELGMLRLRQKEYIITREITDSQRAKEFFFGKFQQLSRKDQKKLTSDFAAYIKKLHDSGILHTDPNLGNFLIQQKEGQNNFYLLDLGDVKTKKTLNYGEKLKNLALINLNFHRFAPESMRYYFFRTYCEGFIKTKMDIRNAIDSIEFLTLRFAHKNWGKRIKWCLENNNFFSVSKRANLKVHLKNTWAGKGLLAHILSSPDAFLSGSKGLVLKDGRTVKAARVDIGNDQHVFLKRYNRKGFFHTFKNIFRSSRAKRVWRNSFGLELRGIPVPATIAHIEERKFRVLLRSYVLSEFLSEAKTLGSIYNEESIKERRLSVMNTLGREVARMHRYGCLHGDLKWSNILIKNIEGTVRCFFVDFDGAKIKKSLGLPDVLPELSRFYAEMLKYGLSPEEKTGFFSSYCRQFKVGLTPDGLAGMASKSIKKRRLD